jgi:putative hemolysin
MRNFEEPADLSEYLRFRTYLLELAIKKDQRIIRLPGLDKVRRRKIQDVSHPQDFNALAQEVGNLSAHQRLVDQKEFSVYYARAGQIPRVLAEIGRLREKTFRAAGEGTGKSTDLDRFDNFYIHFFLWHKQKMEVAGAYRLAPTDEILPRYGKKGLYTQTLFRYRKEFLEMMGPALEMGRTFVRVEYQKEYSALLLLWKGIGRFVSKNPRYRILFGAVSISNDYSSYSRQLMVSFLRLNNFFQELSRMVKPRRHFRNQKIIALSRERVKFRGDDLEELSAWVSCVEEDSKGVPILLKQYLKLGGKFLSFNVDPDFGDVVDGLILVNLTETDDRILKRYMTDEGYERFMAYHSAADPAHGLAQV